MLIDVWGDAIVFLRRRWPCLGTLQRDATLGVGLRGPAAALVDVARANLPAGGNGSMAAELVADIPKKSIKMIQNVMRCTGIQRKSRQKQHQFGWELNLRSMVKFQLSAEWMFS